MRNYAAVQGVDPVSLASQNPRLDTEAEAGYRRAVSVYEAMVDSITDSLPPDLGVPLARGDPTPLLLNAPSFFPDVQTAHSFVCFYITARCIPVENWLPKTSDPPGSFFRSPAFLKILESSIIVVRTIATQMAQEPGLWWSRPWAMVPVMRVGGLYVAAVKMCRESGDAETREGFAKDLRIVYRWLIAMGGIHKPLGTLFLGQRPFICSRCRADHEIKTGRTLALNFRKVMLDAGVETSSPAALSEISGGEADLSLVKDVDLPMSFTAMVLAAESWCKPWLR
jgi:hypothetical protein